ncbi:uncharacterized protein LOC102803437 [Saccoglossus kowalevskii]|uniref:Ankyrin repeat domain-containing protein 11-like n=1 Tax=Saccoglossus kowalevskii TaxID=10224 RepID=A0ABM0M1B1_SACKO|nr:PREDICTED: ankyrin repeat domain-containing protein 11-like [Saccoglossus kowalevskii]
MAEKSLSHKKEKPPIMKSPSSRQETKTLKRKLFSSLSSLPENEDKKTIKHPPSKKRRPSSRPTSPPVPASTPPSRGGNSGRLIPLSERQQLAMLMQMTSEEHSPESTSKQSPQTPTGVRKTSIMTTPTFGLTSSAIKAKVNKRNEKGETQLHIAAIKGDIISTKALIKQGADVNCQDFAGWTPLHEACNHGFYDVARQLLEAGANVNIQGFNDITPLHDAAVNGHVKVVELLLKHGADPLQANNLGQTPMTIARSPSILQLLKNEIISSSSDVSTPEVRSPTSPESSCSNEDGLQVKKDIGAPGNFFLLLVCWNVDVNTFIAPVIDDGSERS